MLQLEEYDYQWLLEILVEVRMAKKVIPTFWTSDNDPKEITELKNKLYKMNSELEFLEHYIYGMMKNVE